MHFLWFTLCNKVELNIWSPFPSLMRLSENCISFIAPLLQWKNMVWGMYNIFSGFFKNCKDKGGNVNKYYYCMKKLDKCDNCFAKITIYYILLCCVKVKFYSNFLQGNWKLKVQRPVIQDFGNVLTSLLLKYLTKPAFLLFLDSLLVHFSSNRKMEPFFPTLQWLRPKKGNTWPWFVFLVKSTNWNLLLTNTKLGKLNDYLMGSHLKYHLQKAYFYINISSKSHVVMILEESSIFWICFLKMMMIMVDFWLIFSL